MKCIKFPHVIYFFVNYRNWLNCRGQSLCHPDKCVMLYNALMASLICNFNVCCSCIIIIWMLHHPYCCVQPRWRAPPWLMLHWLPFSNSHSPPTHQHLSLLHLLPLLNTLLHPAGCGNQWRAKERKDLSQLHLSSPIQHPSSPYCSSSKIVFKLFMLVSSYILYLKGRGQRGV